MYSTHNLEERSEDEYGNDIYRPKQQTTTSATKLASPAVDKGDTGLPSGRTIFVPASQPWGNPVQPAWSTPAAAVAVAAVGKGAVAVAAIGKGPMVLPPKRPILVPPSQPWDDNPGQPAFTVPPQAGIDHSPFIRARSDVGSNRSDVDRRGMKGIAGGLIRSESDFSEPPLSENLRPRHTDGSASRPAPPARMPSAARDNHDTTVGEDLLQPETRTDPNARQTPTATAAPGRESVADNKSSAAAVENVSSDEEQAANPSQSVPTAPSTAAKPSPPPRATPALAGSSDTTASKNRSEPTFCERLLSCFGLCS